MFEELYMRIIVFIKDKFFNKALQKVIIENRSDNNWDKIEKSYCLSKDEQTLVIVNNKDSIQTIEVYERELFKFIWVANIVLDDRSSGYKYHPINFITINERGDHIAIARNNYRSEVLLFNFINNKWKHKKTYKKYIVEKENYIKLLKNIKNIKFYKHLKSKKEVLVINMESGVAIVHEYYKNKTIANIPKMYF